MAQTAPDIQALQERITQASVFVDDLEREIARTITGQRRMVSRLITGLLCNGHVLLEGVPGLAKTLAIRSLAQAVDARFSRIQFTPDLLPADVVGTMVYNPQTQQFVVRKGPVFAHFVLADEINRAPAKVQSALLEAMQERQVTIGDQTYPLEEPFLVLATQNPLDQEGTYPLPEAQLDRFMLKVLIGYPDREEERAIIRQHVQEACTPSISKVVGVGQILDARSMVREVYMDPRLEDYIIDIVFATRDPGKYRLEKLRPLIGYGGSPRASIWLALAAKASAFIQKRAHVIPEDVRGLAADVLRHRIGLTYEAEADGVGVEEVIAQILGRVQVP
jgi:MoxR-like ATPase